MAEYYKESFGRRGHERKKKRTKSVWTVLADWTMHLVSLLLICTTVTILAMHYTPPQRMWELPVLTLFAPIVYILDIAAMLYWVIRWRWRYALAMCLFVLICTIYLPLYCKIDLARKYDTKYVERNFTKVVTYNIANGNNSELVDYVRGLRPDIVCLQEYLTDADEKWRALGDEYRSTISDGNDFSCEIFTKYRILRQGEIDSLGRYTAVWADLRIADDTVRVVSLHLQSTSIHPEDTQFIQRHEYIYDTERETKLRSIVSRLAENTRKRAVQVEHIRRFIDATPYKTIICGDFNDVPLSYAYHRIANGLNDTFSEAGNGYSYTFDGYFRLLRIDYTLVSPSIETISYESTDSVAYSDHYPVVTRLKINKQQTK